MRRDASWRAARRAGTGNGSYVLFGLGSVLLLCLAVGVEGQSPRNREPIRHVTETATWEVDGRRLSAEVDLQKWIIGGGQEIEALPLPGPGLRIVKLAAGQAATIIDRERRERAEGEYWAVHRGQTMSVETEDDSAILLTISVRTP